MVLDSNVHWEYSLSTMVLTSFRGQSSGHVISIRTTVMASEHETINRVKVVMILDYSNIAHTGMVLL
jgi:hypothetical protein